MKKIIFCIFLLINFGFSQNIELLEKAKQGDVTAQYQVASIYHKKNNIVEAIKWYKMAADEGRSGAQFYLGKIYLNGEGGIDKNVEEAIKYLSLSAKQGAVSAQYELAIIYLEGKEVPQNINEGIKWMSEMGCAARIQSICDKLEKLK